MEQRIHNELMPTIGEYFTMTGPDNYESPSLLSASETEELLNKTELIYADCN